MEEESRHPTVDRGRQRLKTHGVVGDKREKESNNGHICEKR